MDYTKYTNPKRNTSGGNQSEKPEICIENNKVTIKGYQQYEISKNGIVSIKKNKIQNQWNLIKNLQISIIETVCDLGCSGGAIGLLFASNFKAKQLYLLDHDKEYISMLDNLIHWLDINIKVIISKFEFGIDALDTYDVIITLSTIHWFYSATTNIGCLFTIIKMLADKVNKYLIIEWIDPEDSAIKSFHHIDFNKTVHKTAYTRENLELALSNNFTNVIKVGKTERYREIYFCSKL